MNKLLLLTATLFAVSLCPLAAQSEATDVVPPQPQPAPEVAPPSLPPTALFVGPPDRARVQRAIPVAQLWRDGSNVPQTATSAPGHFDPFFITGTEPSTLVLRFTPLLAGAAFAITPGPGVTIQADTTNARVGPTGEIATLVFLESARRSGRIAVEVDGVTSVFNVMRVPISVAVARENGAQGGRP